MDATFVCKVSNFKNRNGNIAVIVLNFTKVVYCYFPKILYAYKFEVSAGLII